METSTIAGAALALAAAGLAICVAILRRLGRIEGATLALAVNSHAIRGETDTLFRQIQALLALEKKLGLLEAMPPMRGTASVWTRGRSPPWSRAPTRCPRRTINGVRISTIPTAERNPQITVPLSSRARTVSPKDMRRL